MRREESCGKRITNYFHINIKGWERENIISEVNIWNIQRGKGI